jgi:WD40-like Beta Propeller Repeat
VIVVVIVASCIILVAISYMMLNVLTGLVITPKTPVREIAAEGELIIPAAGKDIVSMQASADGRFLAFLEGGGEGEELTSRVVELTRDTPEVFNHKMTGKTLAWLGSSYYLVFEDQGDIQAINIEDGTQANLTSSAEFDGEPIPSPDGRYILWSKSPTAVESEEAEFWVMNSDGSKKVPLAPRALLATWDPTGARVISMQRVTETTSGKGYRLLLQTAVPGEGRWVQYAECEGEARFIWWPLADELLYISPQLLEDKESIKGVWYRVSDPNSQKRVASTDGLDFDEAYYHFYPSRRGERLAYVGEKGLEYLDYGERVIYRYTVAEPRIPLAWNEDRREIYYVGADGIYKVLSGSD